MITSRNIKIITWFNFFTDLRFYSAIAIIYFAKVSGSFALGMAIFSIVMLTSAILELPTGIFSDMLGRRKTVILGAFFIVLAVVFYALGQYHFLIIGAIAEGISRSFYSGNNDALLYDSLAQDGKEERYDHFLGTTTAPAQVAGAIAAVTGGLIAFISFNLVMWLSVIPQLFCLVLSFYLIEPKIEEKIDSNIYSHLKEAVVKFKQNNKLRMLSLSSIISYGVGEASWQFQTAFYNTLWPIWALGIAKTLSNIGAAFSFQFSGRIIRKFSALKLLLASSLYNRTIGLVATLFPTMVSPLLMSSTSLTFGASTVAESSLMQAEFTEKQRATMGSLNSFAGSLFFAIFAYFLGLVADSAGPAKALVLVNVVLLSVTVIYTKLFRQSTAIAVSTTGS